MHLFRIMGQRLINESSMDPAVQMEGLLKRMDQSASTHRFIPYTTPGGNQSKSRCTLIHPLKQSFPLDYRVHC